MVGYNWETPFDPSFVHSCRFLISLPTTLEENLFLREAELLGCAWCGGEAPTTFVPSNLGLLRLHSDLVIRVDIDGELQYDRKQYFDEHDAGSYDDWVRCTYTPCELGAISIPDETCKILL